MNHGLLIYLTSNILECQRKILYPPPQKPTASHWSRSDIETILRLSNLMVPANLPFDKLVQLTIERLTIQRPLIYVLDMGDFILVKPNNVWVENGVINIGPESITTPVGNSNCISIWSTFQEASVELNRAMFAQQTPFPYHASNNPNSGMNMSKALKSLDDKESRVIELEGKLKECSAKNSTVKQSDIYKKLYEETLKRLNFANDKNFADGKSSRVDSSPLILERQNILSELNQELDKLESVRNKLLMGQKCPDIGALSDMRDRQLAIQELIQKLKS